MMSRKAAVSLIAVIAALTTLALAGFVDDMLFDPPRIASFQPRPSGTGGTGSCACSVVEPGPADASPLLLVSFRTIVPEPGCTGRPRPIASDGVAL